MTCQHDRLYFGSGDYYVFCMNCNAFWARMGIGRMEYGKDANGCEIGADPLAANKKFVSDLKLRVIEK